MANHDLDRSLRNNGYKAHNDGSYSKDGSTVHTDGDHWRKDNGSWNHHKNGRNAG